ncbi:MAG: hypothetical protein LBG92_05975 [Prevotellaceae bacterium]|jgi:hypothetical protein|nr:hypothetical protein [Prevotellaceae bacterium]
MNNSHFIPRRDVDFHQWVNSFMTYLGTESSRLGFPADKYQSLTALKSDFEQKFNAAENPSTRTSLSVQAKNEARAALEKELRQYIKEYLTYSSVVTDVDRNGLGLPVHKTSRTPSPVAATYPDYDIDSSVIRRLTVHFFDSANRSKAKPDGQHGVEIKWGILETPPSSIDDLPHSAFDTHTPMTLSFDENQRGKTVYFCLCWENTRGEKGPWSEIISAIVP